MFGNLVNNRQLRELIRLDAIEITPFKDENLSLAHYTLHIRKIKRRLVTGEFKTVHDFAEDDNTFKLEPDEFVVIEIQEVIKLKVDNIVGHFIPASNLIEDGLGLVAGKIDKKFGASDDTSKQTKIHFGLKNLQKFEVKLEPFYRVAHLSLFDLRGVMSEQTQLSEEEIKIRIRRLAYAMDNGVVY